MPEQLLPISFGLWEGVRTWPVRRSTEMHIPSAALLAHEPRAETCKLSVPAPQHTVAGEPLRIEGADLVAGAAYDTKARLVSGKIVKTVEPSVCRHV
jgi:hypothetical protein